MIKTVSYIVFFFIKKKGLPQQEERVHGENGIEDNLKSPSVYQLRGHRDKVL